MASRIIHTGEFQQRVVTSYLLGFTIRQLAEKLSINFSTAYRILQDNKIRSRPKVKKKKALSMLPSLERIMNYYQEDYMNSREIALLYCTEPGLLNLMISQIREVLRGQGILKRQGRPKNKTQACTQCDRLTLDPTTWRHLPFCSHDCKAIWIDENSDKNRLCSAPIFYVYGLITPIEIELYAPEQTNGTLHFLPGDVFYIGKGHNDRMYAHEKHPSNLYQRGVIEEIHDQGQKIIYKKLENELTESQAFASEIKWIEKIGFSNLANFNHGGTGEKATEETKKLLSIAATEAYKDPKVKAKAVEAVRKTTSGSKWKRSYMMAMKRLKAKYPWMFDVFTLIHNHEKYKSPFPTPVRTELERFHRARQQHGIVITEFEFSKKAKQFFLIDLPILKKLTISRVINLHEKGLSTEQILNIVCWEVPPKIKQIIKKHENSKRRDVVDAFIENGLEDFVLDLYHNQDLKSLGLIFERIPAKIRTLIDRDFPSDGRHQYRVGIRQKVKEIFKKHNLKPRSRGKMPLSSYTDPNQLSKRMQQFCDYILEGLSPQEAGSLVKPIAGRQQIKRWLGCLGIVRYLEGGA